MEAKDWEMMYLILHKGISDAVDMLAERPGSRDVISFLVKTLLKACDGQVTVCRDLSGEEAAEMKQDLMELFENRADC